MFTLKLRAPHLLSEFASGLSHAKPRLRRAALLLLYLLMTVQFVGCYLFLSHPYLDFFRFSHGHERLPFQTRLLLAPLFRWALQSPLLVRWASRWSADNYFFPRGIGPGGILELWLDIPCVVIAGWVATRIYQAASRRGWLAWAVYPLFLVLSTVTYTLHAVQNFRFVYDLPSLMFFALGLYIIYFRKSTLLLVALFAFATLNRETTLLLLPFFVLSACVRPDSTWHHSHAASHTLALVAPCQARARFEWRRALDPDIAIPTLLMLGYWIAWHVFIFHLFRNNASEYYPRLRFNWIYLSHARYYPQLLSAFDYLFPFLIIFRSRIRDGQLRAWLWLLPGWYVLMAVWGLLVETRIFGELLPFLACVAALIGEEALAAAVRKPAATKAGAEQSEESAPLAQAA
jgi:hypothetical protein